jgi:hypothetical protein
LRYSLLATASLIAVALAVPAQAEDCGCRDRVRAALSRQTPVVTPAPQPRRVAPVQAQASAQAGYDYASARAVDMYPYRQRWEVAPQGYVPPAPMAYAPPMPYGPQGGMATYANPAYPDGWAYNYQPQGIEIDQGGWYGGVGYNSGGDGGGGGMTLTMAQPDASNGPSYNNFNNSYGGSYGATNQVNAWQADAFKPKTTTATK